MQLTPDVPFAAYLRRPDDRGLMLGYDDMRDRSIEEGERAHKNDPVLDGQVAVEVDLVVGLESEAGGVLDIRHSVSNGVLDHPLSAAAVAAAGLSGVVSSGVDIEGLAAGPEAAVGHKGSKDAGVSISDFVVGAALAAE